MNNSSSDWYQDHTQLLDVMRRGRGRLGGVPVIPGYQDLRELRRGGQGVVYVARQLSTRREVAIKVLLDARWASDRRLRRFEREVELVANLQHPNIVKLFDSGLTDEGHPFYVMEYVRGCGLDELSSSVAERGGCVLPGEAGSERMSPAGAPLSVQGAVQLFAKVCEAVGYAHQHGVIHRDIKPGNILIDLNCDPHVLDFGLAKRAVGGAMRELTELSVPGEFMGTVAWASPEQIAGESVDMRSDVYSLGVVLFYLLTGRFPYAVGGSLSQVIANIQSVEAPRPSSVRSGVDDEIDTIALRCLAKEPDRRYQSAGELARDVRRYLAGEPILAKSESAWYGMRKKLRRYRLAVGAVVLTLVASLAYAVSVSVLYQRAVRAEELAGRRLVDAQEARDEANAEATKARAVLEQLKGILSAARPERHGRDVRVADLLDEADVLIGETWREQPEVAIELGATIGQTYLSLGLYEEAGEHLERAYELARKTYGADDLRALEAAQNLGVLRIRQGRAEEAAELLNRCLAGRREALGGDDPDTAAAASNLAVALKRLRRFDEAEALYREALATLEGSVGIGDPRTLDALHNLGVLLGQQGRLEESEELLRRSLDAHRDLLGLDHPETLMAETTLAETLLARDKLDEAEGLLRTNLERRRERLGPEHFDTTTTMYDLAELLRLRGKLAEACEMSAEVARIRERVLGADHRHTLLAKNDWALSLMGLERLEEAERILREVYETRLAKLGRDSTDTQASRYNLVMLWARQGRTEEVLEALAEIVVDARAVYPPEHPAPLVIQSHYGEQLWKAGRVAEAEQQLVESYEGLRERLGDDHRYTRTARERLEAFRGAGEEQVDSEEPAGPGTTTKPARRP